MSPRVEYIYIYIYNSSTDSKQLPKCEMYQFSATSGGNGDVKSDARCKKTSEWSVGCYCKSLILPTLIYIIIVQWHSKCSANLSNWYQPTWPNCWILIVNFVLNTLQIFATGRSANAKQSSDLTLVITAGIEFLEISLARSLNIIENFSKSIFG